MGKHILLSQGNLAAITDSLEPGIGACELAGAEPDPSDTAEIVV